MREYLLMILFPGYYRDMVAMETELERLKWLILEDEATRKREEPQEITRVRLIMEERDN